ncbi:MAG TPA: hypothetical protein P5179_03830 [Candidatus Latescibacteria bacterium]|nr:hypothetical protein [Candidatus Latescibacterota bacterium]
MDVFAPSAFLDPPSKFRPLQIVHGFDRFLEHPGDLIGEEGIGRRLDQLRRVGIGGVVSNVGGGFGEYLLEERQWEVWVSGMQQAHERGMVLWWYDEKGYPSGTAGGIVTRANPSLCAVGLACYSLSATGPGRFQFVLPASCLKFEVAFASGDFDRVGMDGVIGLTSSTDENGCLYWEVPEGDWTVLYLAQRYMYEGTHAAANVCEFKHYVNLLEPEATRRFLAVTHDEYFRRTPPGLWKNVRAVFTDEPSLMTGYAGPLPQRFQGNVPVIDKPLFRDRPVAVPWSQGLVAAFTERKGYDPKPRLWCLFCGEHEDARAFRQDFYEIVTELYTNGFYRQVRNWCDRHNIAFSGHVMAEEWLGGHVEYHGSLFAPVREMSLPGIDMLDSDPVSILEGHGFMTAKQVASIAHLTGAQQVHSECSDWSQRNNGRGATLEQRYGQGGLLYVLGVNQVTAYWSWDDIGDEAYRTYNDYMGRLGMLLRGGVHRCDVAVLYPIRTAWLDFLPHASYEADNAGQKVVSTAGARERFNAVGAAYADTVRDLLRSQIDLDIIDEQALTEGIIGAGALHVAGESYRVIVLPQCEAISLSAAEALAAFGRSGGLVVSIGAPPRLVESARATAKVHEGMEQLFGARGNGRILKKEEVVPYLRSARCATLELAEANPSILCTERSLDGRGLCMIVNASGEPQLIRPRSRLREPLDLYRPLDGSIAPFRAGAELHLGSFESVFLVAQAPSPPV